MSEKPTEAGSDGLPKRWSARRRSDVVLRLLPGEDIGQRIRVPPPELERWWRTSLECCGFRRMPITDSSACRSPIPMHADHL